MLALASVRSLNPDNFRAVDPETVIAEWRRKYNSIYKTRQLIASRSSVVCPKFGTIQRPRVNNVNEMIGNLAAEHGA